VKGKTLANRLFRKQREAEALRGMYPLPSGTEVADAKASLGRKDLHDGRRTWLGRIINDGDLYTTTYSKLDNYPLRLCLQEISCGCWSIFLDEQQRPVAEVIDAAHAVTIEYNAYVGFLRQCESDEQPASAEYDLWEETSIVSGFEFWARDWPRRRLEGKNRFTWQDVPRLAELVAVDYAIRELEEKRPHKAAVWLYRATELSAVADSYDGG
jgi:hypothetical protein